MATAVRFHWLALIFNFLPCAFSIGLRKHEAVVLPLMALLSVGITYGLTSATVRKWTCFVMDPTWANPLVGLPQSTPDGLRGGEASPWGEHRHLHSNLEVDR